MLVSFRPVSNWQRAVGKIGVAYGLLLAADFEHGTEKIRVSLKISFGSRTFNFGKLSYLFKMFRVMGASK